MTIVIDVAGGLKRLGQGLDSLKNGVVNTVTEVGQGVVRAYNKGTLTDKNFLRAKQLIKEYPYLKFQQEFKEFFAPLVEPKIKGLYLKAHGNRSTSPQEMAKIFRRDTVIQSAKRGSDIIETKIPDDLLKKMKSFYKQYGPKKVEGDLGKGGWNLKDIRARQAEIELELPKLKAKLNDLQKSHLTSRATVPAYKERLEDHSDFMKWKRDIQKGYWTEFRILKSNWEDHINHLKNPEKWGHWINTCPECPLDTWRPVHVSKGIQQKVLHWEKELGAERLLQEFATDPIPVKWNHSAAFGSVPVIG